MRANIILLGLTMLLAVACAHQVQREPASVDQDQESAHQKHQGVFDRY